MHIERIGHEVNWSPSQKMVGLPYGNTTFLLKDIVMQDGLLFAYSAYFLSNQPIRFELTHRHFSTDFDKVIDFVTICSATAKNKTTPRSWCYS